MHEKPVLFGESESLVGIYCSPADDARRDGIPTGIFLNAGIVHRAGPNRLYVNLARALAERGIPSLRFDLGGIGDSRTAGAQASVGNRVQADIRHAVDLVTTQSSTAGVVLIGLCSGADNSFEAASRDPRVTGCVLLDPNAHKTRSFYFHHYMRALFGRRTWRLLVTGKHPINERIGRLFKRDQRGRTPVREVFLAPSTLADKDTVRKKLAGLLKRQCRLLYVFTGGLPYRYNHEKQFARTFPDLAHHPNLNVKYLADSDHTFSDPSNQQHLIGLVVDWIDSGHVVPTEAQKGGVQPRVARLA